jgi:choline dehydrogenase
VLKENSIVGERVTPPLDITTAEELDNWIRQNVGTPYHWSCTCRSGNIELIF